MTGGEHGDPPDIVFPAQDVATPHSSALPARLERLAERARDYAEAASSANTRRAYASDWRHFGAWCRRNRLEPLPPSPQTVGLYIAACASGATAPDRKPSSVATIERRLSALAWNYAQRGTPLDRRDRHIATVLAGVRNTHARPPAQKEALHGARSRSGAVRPTLPAPSRLCRPG